MPQQHETFMKKTLILITFFTLSLRAFGAFGYTTVAEEDALLTLRQQARETSQESQTILLWNVYKESKDNFKSELKKIQDKYQPSITLFQEAIFKSEEKATCLISSDCFFSQAFTVKNEGFGVLTASQYQIIHAEAIHSDSVEPILYTPKTSLLTILEINNQEVMVINTHGINFVTLFAYQQQLQEVVEKTKDFRGPILWAGDFNSWNPGRYDLLEKATQQLNLKEVQIKNAHLVKSFVSFKLDRVFTRGLKLQKAEAIKTKGSDHNPIVLEVSLP